MLLTGLCKCIVCQNGTTKIITRQSWAHQLRNNNIISTPFIAIPVINTNYNITYFKI